MNHLANEKSPYLLQHKDNPVNWYPWSEDAFYRAREENKPVFLSIGYSTCHWCHVMAHESFMDNEVADLMNRTFINIKVDREERPDIDQTYMSVCQMMTGNGGWPLNLILTSEKNPFFAATYIPKRGHSGRYGMIELVGAFEKGWHENSSPYIERGILIADELQKISASSNKNTTSENNYQDVFHQTFKHFQHNFDAENGGFGYRPKFPSPHNLLFLMLYHKRNKNENSSMAMAEKTLIEMRKGGIYDQIGYGFHRYSTDERWFLPHFEKMLYDQAMHLIAYSTAYMITGHIVYKMISEEIVDYVIREMQSPEGGYYSAQDADSDGEEGKYYIWDFKEIEKILTKDEFHLFLHYYSIKSEGNYVEEASGKFTGQNIISMEDVKRLVEYCINFDDRESLKKIHEKLYNTRSQRIAPQKDDKILTNWNGLMAGAMAFTSSAMLDEIPLESAIKAIEFNSIHLLNQNTSLHRFRDNQAGIEANLEDYAFHIYALLQLYHANADVNLLKSAIQLCDKMVAVFYNPTQGGFFFISEQMWKNENLIIRPQDHYDGAIPSGNSIALYDLIMLKKYTGSTKWNPVIDLTIQTFTNKLKDNAMGHAFFLIALDLYINPGVEIIVNGNKEDLDVKEAVEIIKSIYFPGLVYHARNSDNQVQLSEIVPFTKEMDSPEKPSFYICENYSCKKPIYNLEEFLQTISNLKK